MSVMMARKIGGLKSRCRIAAREAGCVTTMTNLTPFQKGDRLKGDGRSFQLIQRRTQMDVPL